MGSECGKKLLIALEVRREAKSFDGSFQGPWVIDGCPPAGGKEGDAWTVNPLTAIPRVFFELVDVWLDLRLRAAKGGHFLASSGGMMDQPAALMEAFGFLDRQMDLVARGEDEGSG